jgi:hypothetical protein
VPWPARRLEPKLQETRASPRATPALGEVSPKPPEAHQCRCEPQAPLCFPLVPEPPERRPQVVVILLQTFHPRCLLGTNHGRLRLLCQSDEEVRVAPTDGPGFSRLSQLFGGVLPHRLQHPVAGLPITPRHDDERLVHQAREQVEDLDLFDPVAGANLLRRIQSPTPSEHREPAKENPLPLREEVVAPVYSRPERPVTGNGGPVAPQEAKAIVEPLQDLTHGEHPNPGGGELDGERQPVEPRAQIRHRRTVLPRQGETGCDGPGPLDEEPDRLTPE